MLEDKNDISVLIQSSDGYADAWPAFFTLFFRYWPDNPFNIYLCSETKKCDDQRVTTINTGKGKEWSAMLMESLEQIPSRYILFLLEDYLVYHPVDTRWIRDLLEITKSENAACMRLFPVPGPDRSFQVYKGVGIVEKGSEYRVSTQATIWDKQQLKRLLVPSETAWQFEINGTKRSNDLHAKFLSVTARHSKLHIDKETLPFKYIFTGIIRGRWTREAIRLCKSEEIPLDLTVRKTRPVWDPLFQFIYKRSPQPIKHLMDYIYIRLVPSYRPKV